MHLLGSFCFAHMFTVDQVGLDHLPGALSLEEADPSLCSHLLPAVLLLGVESCTTSTIHWQSNSIVIFQGFCFLSLLFPGKSDVGFFFFLSSGSLFIMPVSCYFPVLSCFSHSHFIPLLFLIPSVSPGYIFTPKGSELSEMYK